MLCNHMICPPLVSLKLFWNAVTFGLKGHPCRWLGFNGSLLRRFLLDAKGKKAAALTSQTSIETQGVMFSFPVTCSGGKWKIVQVCFDHHKKNNKNQGPQNSMLLT